MTGMVVIDLADLNTDFAAAGSSFPTLPPGPPALGRGGTSPNLVALNTQSAADGCGRWWDYYDAIPRIRSAAQIHQTEVKSATYSIGWRPDLLTAPAPLEAWDDNPDHTPPEPPAELGAALETLVALGDDSLNAAIGNISIKRWVAGRCYLAAYLPAAACRTDSEASTGPSLMDDNRAREVLTDPTLQWRILSDREIRSRVHGTHRVWQIDGLADNDPTGMTGRWFAAGNIIVADLIRRHPARRELPDTALRSLAGDCDALIALLKTVRIVANSQSAAGVMLIPNTMVHQGDAKATDSGDGRSGPLSATKLLADSLTAPIKDEQAVGAFLPVVLKGPWEQLRSVRWLEMRRSFDTALVTMIELYDRRISVGLDQQTEEVDGVADSNHWSAAEARSRQLDRWSGQEASDIAALVTRALIRPLLAAQGRDDAWQWALVVDTSSMDTARREWVVMELGKAGMMAPSAVLRELGFDPEDAVDTASAATTSTGVTGGPTRPPEQEQQLGALARAAEAMLGQSLTAELEQITGQSVSIPPGDVARGATAAGIDLAGDHAASLEEVTATVVAEATRILADPENPLPAEMVSALAGQIAGEWRANLLSSAV